MTCRVRHSSNRLAPPAAGLEGLAAQARTFLTEYELDRRSADEEEGDLEFSRIGAVLAEGVARLAAGG